MNKALLYFVLPSSIALSAYAWSQRSEPTPMVDSQPDLRHASMHLAPMTIDAPHGLTFAGEPVPLEDSAVRERLIRELTQKVHHSAATRLLYKRVMRYETTFREILAAHKVPEDFFYLSIAESGLSNAVSPVGAAGFWQFMPATARAYGLTVSAEIDERFHPEKATSAAARYLKDMYEDLGAWSAVAAAYNMGLGGFTRAQERQGVDSYYELELNRETGNYLYRILSYKCVLEQPARYGIEFADVRPYADPQFKSIRVTKPIADLSSFAAKHEVDLAMLRGTNPWLLGHSLSVASGQTHTLRIPLNKDFYAAELVVNGWTQSVAGEEEEIDADSTTFTASADTTIRAAAS